MRRRSWILVAIVAIIVVAGASTGVALAQSDISPTDVTPAQLLARVMENAGETDSISGAVEWKNDLLGLSMLSFGGKGAGGLTDLIAAGSGRVWLQEGKARLEIQGMASDTQVFADDTGLWVYSSGDNTATHYTLPEAAPSALSSWLEEAGRNHTGDASPADPVATIQQHLEEMAPYASLAVDATADVAGRDCYILALAPTADNTVFGSVRVAIDAETFVPLRIEVFAKGGQAPVLSGGFTKVSYSEVGDDIFVFTPPANAVVEEKELTLPDFGELSGPAETSDADKAHESLTIAEAAARGGYTPLTPDLTDPMLPFQGAHVLPAETVDFGALLAELGGGGAGWASPETDEDVPGPTSFDIALPNGPVTLGPTVIQRYGEGFGTVMLVEAKVPVELSVQLERMLALLPIVGRSAVGSVTVYQLDTALGSVAVWTVEDSLLMAGGSVSQADLKEFIASVR